MTIAFAMRGLAELFLCAALALGLTRSTRSWTGLLLLALSTVCSFLVAIFPADLQNASILLIHSLSGLLGFSSLAVAARAWSQRFRKDPFWCFSARVSLMLGLLMLLSLLGSLVGSSAGLQGLTERILEIFIVIWLCFLSWRLSTLASPKG